MRRGSLRAKHLLECKPEKRDERLARSEHDLLDLQRGKSSRSITCSNEAHSYESRFNMDFGFIERGIFPCEVMSNFPAEIRRRPSRDATRFFARFVVINNHAPSSAREEKKRGKERFSLLIYEHLSHLMPIMPIDPQ